MENLSKLLDELTNNASFRKPLTAAYDFSQGSDTLFSGFPGDLDQFHSLGRIKRTPKKQSDQEFEIELLSKIDILNDALFEHKVDIDIVKKAYVQIGESIQELSGMILDQHSDIYQRAYSKFQLLREIYSQLDVVVSGTKKRKLKDPDVELTQAQIVILFHHLQRLGVLSKKVTNITLATCLSEITGFEFHQLRKSLSSVSLFSENVDANFKPSDYSALDLKVESLKEHLKKESIERFK
jgi:hypothetical protein